MKNKCRKLIFLLFSSSRVDLFVKKQNCRNFHWLMRPQSQRLKIKCAQNLIAINGSLNCDVICNFYFFSVTLPWSWFTHPNHAPRIIKTSLICNILVLSPTRSTGSCLLWLDTATKFRHMLLLRTWSCVVLEL